MSAESLAELRAWFADNKTSPECVLALKHRAAMAPGVAEELKARAPGDSDEEKELGLVFALTQIAEKLDMTSLVLAGIQVEHLPPAAAPAVPEVVAASHVDVTPLAEVPAAEK